MLSSVPVVDRVESRPEYQETDELAKARNRAAADRTLMAWVRTSLALIAFGFGIQRIVAAMTSGRVSTGLTAFVTLSFIALGVYGLISAAHEYQREGRALLQSRFELKPGPPHALILAALLAAIGAIAFVGILEQVIVRR